MSEYKDVWVFSERHDLMLEMLGKGREIADKLQMELGVVLVGFNVQRKADELIRYGADKVYLVDDQALELFQLEAYLSVLHSLATSHKPQVILIGSTRNAKPLAARLATRLDAGCAPDCAKLSVDEQKRLVCERITYGGNAATKIAFRAKPQIVTIPSRAFEKPAPKDRTGQILKLDVKIEAPKTEIVDTKPLETSAVRIEDADVIISCGRGLEKKDDKVLLDELASVLCGQVGCSRPLAEDRKWFTEWVGLSGHKVKPKLYIACGISGVIQHVAGIRDAKVIVAINKDENAPIFELADYGVVGNLYEILPALKEALERQLQ
ncbi:MAG: electron transfer flavoprotein subunit alpha/FixB family protein [Candidatus Bathyarchaeota archaeon]|nr:electron transfer flavoprotein subunit alpha/FixB family protein [Candidatus Bathyarchaeota archaeon]MDH5787106.1 electron transfer flavoprotein subunit alpha/FixB family protein [Candidatus Bathyarchaeota archaeon]